MPKRKRDGYANDADRVQDMRKKGVEEKLMQSKKVLHKALKNAKGLYRQKLGKKEKLAKGKNDAQELARIRREIVALKGLDLDKATDALLHKTLLRSDAIAASDLLPPVVNTVAPKPEGTEEQITALHNVVSGVYNMATVKDALTPIMNGLYIAFGIPAPAPGSKSKSKAMVKVNGAKTNSITGNDSGQLASMHGADDLEAPSEVIEESEWNGFESDNEGSEQDDEQAEGSLDDDELARYDALLGASSDEESFDENLPRSTMSLRDLSITPSPSASPEPEFEPQAKKAKAAKPRDPAQKAGGSTFLPTLMGGYWSGSESEASDIEEIAAPPVRKNRKGQMARRAIAEKKFGTQANHVKKGLGLKGQTPRENVGWDAKRGAKESGDRGRGAGGRQRNFERATGENAIAVKSRTFDTKKRDDAGPLHASWQAAKKAKEAQKTATFQGKKVTF
ncbi:hypothetical protein BP5796_03877 [Coleophoma crateriformis]|uniref:Bud22 domain-containing protein n=1 Tax=Coleophoma crateriformis TaxID=565419 RepID=A0A3D8SH06_9HELO|nr:hypothetical protein BP5796_03877 [Coleophoma crateriformis]